MSFQIVDMARRRHTQERQGEIDRPAVRVEFRHDRNRRRIDIGDDAEEIAGIEGALLGRNVGGRKVKSKQGSYAGSRGFRHDFAGPLVIEAIDRHAVEAGNAARLPGALAEKGFRGLRLRRCAPSWRASTASSRLGPRAATVRPR